MIPIKLSLAGFLSYREPAELDFTSFELACIAGANGAGKSSLLDAITWVLFGQARKRDDSLINAQSDLAEVSMIFSYEGNIYRVQRSKPRDKTTVLEFHILQSGEPGSPDCQWKPLTERTMRETETLIRDTLRLDYETFINAAFFLQGNADQFTQQRPGDRKRILGSILGLEIWEIYRQRAVERRKKVEAEMAGLDARLYDIDIELGEEQQRRDRLEQLRNDLEQLSKERAVQESALENVRQIRATLAERRKLVGALGSQLQSAERQLQSICERIEARQEERRKHAETLQREGQIRAAYQEWQQARSDLERWEEIAGRFREQEKRREEPRSEINAARVGLQHELDTLEADERVLDERQAAIANLDEQIDALDEQMAAAEALLAERAEMEEFLQEARQRQAEAKSENERLKLAMNELKERIDQLAGTEGVTCPLCGQPLSQEDRVHLVEDLKTEGTEMGNLYRSNLALMGGTEERVKELERNILALGEAEREARLIGQKLAQLTERQKNLRQLVSDWEIEGAPHLAQIRTRLVDEDYAPEARARLAEIDAELKEIGYDAAAHDAARQAEHRGRAAEEDLRALERAQAALQPLERELADLREQSAAQEAEVARQRGSYDEAAASLAAAEAQAPDLESAERDLYRIQEQENRLRVEVGAAQQRVDVLGDLKKRRKKLSAQREELALTVSEYRQLERAFSKDGVPALLIEQALPQIESKANEILDRLSGGKMSVRFITQAEYKDKRRDDLRETLDIQIIDSAGPRDYEMFSGGEAFRVNFAIRLALSEVLAQRAGARLQTLVIDEGFGSQDEQGRQRLVEAINMVRQDFEKILVITHIDALKDVFPTRIEVEKTPQGSTLQVVG